jgi:hypothetical protein
MAAIPVNNASPHGAKTARLEDQRLVCFLVEAPALRSYRQANTS